LSQKNSNDSVFIKSYEREVVGPMQLEQKLREISLRIEELTAANSSLDETNEFYAQIYYFATRIHLYLQLTEETRHSYKQEIRNDWEHVVKCVSRIQGNSEVASETISCAFDIILLLNPKMRELLLAQLDFGTRYRIKRLMPLRFVTFSCALKMARYCLYQRQAEAVGTIVENIIALSELYNQEDLDIHRECVQRALYWVVDINPQVACKLCDQQKKYYADTFDYDTSRFLWLYGTTLHGAGRKSEALYALEKCHKMCIEVEGDDSWIGARAGHIFYASLLNTDKTQIAEDFLWDLVKKIDKAYYPDLDSQAQFVKMSTLAGLLAVQCQRQTLRYYPSEIQCLRDFCYKNAGKIKNPCFTVRFAENLQGAYLLEKEEYLEATNHILNALNAEQPEGISKTPSDLILYTNLLQAYSYLNDIEQIRRYCALVLQESKDDSVDEATLIRCNMVLKFAYQRFDVNTYSKQDHSYIDEYYNAVCQKDIRIHSNKNRNILYAQSVLDQLDTLLRHGSCSIDELEKIVFIIKHFIKDQKEYPFNDIQKSINYSILAFAQMQMGSDDAIDSILRSLDLSKNLSSTNENKITNLCFAAALFYRKDETEKCKAFLSEVLSCISDTWKKAIAYVDDKRLCQSLGIVQKQFGTCYSKIRCNVDSKDVYESVLMFKDLSALAGRERNRILRLAPVDDALQAQLFALQDQLADAELKDSLTGTNTRQQIVSELQKLEATFAEKFPRNIEFTEISFDRVCASLPDNSAILEYHFAVTTPSVSDFRKTQIELDLFVLAKQAGSVQFKHLVIPNGLEVIENTETYVNALQNPDDLSLGAQRNTLPCWLYDSIVKPAIPYLSNIDTVYVAPDDQLSNLPFEILHAENGSLLQDVYTVCRIVCGRDLLFDASDAKGKNCFILGDPNYEAVEGTTTVSDNRRMGSSLSPVFSLPFSGIEAERVARKLDVQSFTGDAATKYALQQALPCRIIHLATHGVFDEELNTDALYSSHLVFAGYNKWVANAEESLLCGNGILTADEISRMDLHQTELVVLSACQSGIVGLSNRSVHGLVSAFAAAGVHWVICHMWEAADFTTPILMDAFYEAYLNQGKAVPEALQYAKNYLRNVTIGELRQAGWLDEPSDPRIKESTKSYLEAMRQANDRRRPFADEYYWGGFTVHKTR